MTRFQCLLFVLAGAFYWTMVSGCTFSAPQFESTIKLAQGFKVSDEARSTDEPVQWLASVDGTGAVLNPYVANGFTVFANADGDAIAFDGWTIRSVVGFGLQEPLSISGKEGVRTFMIANRKTQSKCGEWSLAGLIWSQICSNGTGEIVLDDEGNIQKITVAIGNELGVITLRVAK